MRRYTKEQIDFLKKIVNEQTNSEITAIFNQHFGTTFTKESIEKAKNRYGLYSYVNKNKRFTPEQIQFVLDNAKGKTIKEIVNLFIARFQLSISRKGIENILSRKSMFHVIKREKLTNEQIQFIKDNIHGRTINILDAVYSRRLRSGVCEFQVGTERENTQGVTLVKVANGKWRPKHILIWEQANGKVPKGQCIIFLDKNRRNFTLDNLIMVSKNELLRLNNSKLYFEKKEFTKTGIMIVRHKATITDILNNTGKEGD
jgi:hypothetical protein